MKGGTKVPVIYMKDDFYSDSRKGKGGKKEPVYESNISKKPQTSRTPTGKRVSDFKLDIPEEDTIFSSPRSRTPKGAPVGSEQKAPSVSRYESYNINSKSTSSGNSQRTSPTSSKPYPSRPTAQKEPFKVDIPSDEEIRQKRAAQVNAANKSAAERKSAMLKQKKKSSRSKGVKAVIAVICAIAILFTSVFAYGYSALGKIDYDKEFEKKNQYISSSQLNKSSRVENVLFIGSDARSEIQGMRSDTMILFSIDKKNKKIKLTSFLRDSLVYIPSQGRNRKLNAACSAGGPQLVCDTLEYNFKTEINKYVLVDFEVFTKFIDLLGGLTVKNVSEAEARYLRDKVKIVYAKEGTNWFSGAATLWYCRIRYLDNDFKRTERQRKVISAIIKKVSRTSPAKLLKIVDEIMPMVKTNLTRNELLSLGMGAFFKFLRYDIKQHQIPAEGTWTNASVYGEGSVLKMDIEKNAESLKKFLYGKDKKK